MHHTDIQALPVMNIIIIYYDYKDTSEHRWVGRGHMFKRLCQDKLDGC